MKKKNRKLSSLITAKILIFSSVVTFILTGIQLYFDYETRKSHTAYFVRKVLQTGSSSLAHNLWFVNLPALTNQLKSTLNLSDIAALKLEDLESKVLFFERKKNIESVMITETIDVIYFDSLNQEKNILGKLEVVITSDNILKEIIDKIIFVLINQFIKTIIVSGFIIWLVRTNVTDRVSDLLESVLPFENISKQKISETRKNLETFKSYTGVQDDEISIFRSFLTGLLEKQCEYIISIRNMNVGLEDVIEQRTKEINYKNRSMSMILSNIQQGIFMIDPDLQIEPEFSAHTKEILNEEDLKGKDIMTVFVTKSQLSDNDKSQIYSSLLSSFGQPFVFNLNKHNLPGELVLKDRYLEKYLQVSWEPIIVNNDISQIMVSIRDITELRKYRLEADKKDKESKKLLEIIESGHDLFKDHVKSFNSYLHSSVQMIETGSKDLSLSDIQEIFRNIHTIKGNSRSLNFSELTDCAHMVEQSCQNMVTSEVDLTESSLEDLLGDLKKIRKIIDSYVKIYDEKLSGKIKSGRQDKNTQFIQTMTPLLEAGLKSPEQSHKTLDYLYKLLLQENYSSLRNALHPMIQNLSGYAEFLNIETPVVNWGDHEIWLPTENVREISDVFEHLIRNSLDHGLQKKSEEHRIRGVLSFQVSYRRDGMNISYKDSGRGLNLGSLRKQLASGHHISDEKLAQMIFEAGVTTAESVTQISGRGIGMDIVKSFLTKLGGDIELELVGDLDGDGFRKLRFNIQLPYSIPDFLQGTPLKQTAWES